MSAPFNQKEAIRNLQLYLRTVSLFDPTITRVPTDGIYGNDTRRAVLEFQGSRGLEPTGFVDQKTWDILYEEYLAILRATERPPSPNFFPSHSEGYTASVGEKSSFVAIIQLMLRELGIAFDSIPALSIDGIYGPATAEAVRAFQRAALLEESGEVDLQTYNRLNSAFIALGAYGN